MVPCCRVLWWTMVQVRWKWFLLVTLAELQFSPGIVCQADVSQSGMSHADVNLDWWQTGVIYQIYPRSFKDSNGDGVGDLNGITEQAPYLADLGVGSIWISPFFKSPMADFGYDISDYRAVDPIFGTLQDFTQLLKVYQSLGIKVLLDLVPNHTSDEHEWFQQSVAGVAPYTDYYVWAEAKQSQNGTRLPPSNWLSRLGGSAWTWNARRQKYYLHQYLKKQPDLNFRTPAVLQEIKDIVRFWLDLGVDGFRVDAAMKLVEDDRFLDEPLSSVSEIPTDDAHSLKHIYTRDQPGSYDVIFALRAELDAYRPNNSASPQSTPSSTKFMAVEVSSPVEKNMEWYGNDTVPGAHFPFNFFLLSILNRDSDATVFRDVIQMWYDAMPSGAWANWIIGHHGINRPATRFGRDFMDSLHIIQFLLPGTVITYLGDELAMQDNYIRWSETKDPKGINAGVSRFKLRSRDPERAPFQWNANVSAGFSTNETTWLPVNPDYWAYNLVTQQSSSKSHLSVYKSLVRLKKLPAIQRGSLEVKADADILVIERGHDPASFVAVVNVGDFSRSVDLSEFLAVAPGQTWQVYASSVNCECVEGQVVDVTRLRLRPKAGVVLTNDSATVQTQLEQPSSPYRASSVFGHAFWHVCLTTVPIFFFLSTQRIFGT